MHTFLNQKIANGHYFLSMRNNKFCMHTNRYSGVIRGNTSVVESLISVHNYWMENYGVELKFSDGSELKTGGNFIECERKR